MKQSSSDRLFPDYPLARHDERRRRRLRLLGGAFLLCVLSLHAQTKPFQNPLPNFDRRPASAARVSEQRLADLARLQRAVPSAQVEFNTSSGSPRFIRAADGFLTAPADTNTLAAAAATAPGATSPPHTTIRAFLEEYAGLFGHGAAALDSARVRRDFVSAHNGLRSTVWQQQLDGIPIFEAVFVAHQTARGELVGVSSDFLPDPAAAVDAGALPRAQLVAAPPITASRAIVLAAASVEEVVDESAVRGWSQPVGGEKKQRFTARPLRGDARAELCWLPVGPGSMRLCWDVILTGGKPAGMYRLVIDARSGQAWRRQSLTAYATEATYRVYTSDSPSPLSPGYPTPRTNQPPLVSRQRITTNAVDLVASPNGWINDGDNETLGNNVDAHTDLDGDDLPDLPRPQGSPARVFDFPLDLAQGPETYSAATVVQLFYWCNWMHDRLYELGFTEAAGNFQTDNFDRGGLGEDPLLADAQDGSGVNNSNMSTPPDGMSPRMQMYLFTGPTPYRDAALDAEIVLHEYTHGLSNRRVGGGVGIWEPQTAGMGEGWSDFYALALLSEPGDDVHGTYAAAGYSSYQLDGLLENYYFGIRRYPYTTDLEKNPLTFKDIDPNQAIAHEEVPLSPGFVPFTPLFADEVHSQGELWCVTLWEARANLIDKYGYAVGNRLILQLVTDGMNLSPPNPNFLQARDAILLADRVDNRGANSKELWAAFAKRGLGVSAASPSSATTVGVRESFDQPDALFVSPATDLTAIGKFGGPFSTNSLVYSLTNRGTNLLLWSVLPGAGWVTVTPGSGSLAPHDPAARVRVAFDNSAFSLPAGFYSTPILFSNANSHVAQIRLATLQISGEDSFTESFSTSDTPLGFTSFLFTPNGSAAFYEVCRTPINALPTDPADGNPLTLGDDDSALVTLGGGASVSLYGERTNAFHVGSNGYLTWHTADSNNFAYDEAHFSEPRVSGLFADLDPSSGGSVSWKQLVDRVAVTFLKVPGFFSTVAGGNSFQMELFFDGRIRLSYWTVDFSGAVVGLSRGGGLPAGFQESDFSAYPDCDAPTLAVDLPGAFPEGAGTRTRAGSVSVSAVQPADVTVSLSSSDPATFSVPATVTIPAGNASATFDVTVADDTLLDGTQYILITGSAPGFPPVFARTAVIDNETSAVTVTLPPNTVEGAGALAGTVSLATIPAASIVVHLLSSDTNKLQVPPVVIIPAGATSASFRAFVGDDTKLDGPTIVQVTAGVENWTPGTTTVTVADNEPTLLVVTMPPRTREGRGVLTNAGTVQLGGTLATNLVVALISSDPTKLTVPRTVLVPAGVRGVEFDLTVLDNLAVDGTLRVEVRASAAGFADGAAAIDVLDNETPLPPALPIPFAFASNVVVGARLAWSGGEYAELLVNGDFEEGSFRGWILRPNFYGNFEINAGTNRPPSGDLVTPPFEGRFAAVGDEFGPGPFEMYQEFTIPATASRVTLNWVDRVRNRFSRFDSTQEYRVEIRDAKDVVLAVAHRTLPGDPLLGDWMTRSFDLTPFAGQTVRLAFVVNPGDYYMDVHLDAVSVAVSNPGDAVFEVFLATHPTLGPADDLGSTTNSFWILPRLEPATTYYWQVIARTLGSAAGPVWSFTTRGVDHFEWNPVPSPQWVRQPFDVVLTAKDEFNTTVSNFNGTVRLRGSSGRRATASFAEDFEAGALAGWTYDSDSVTHTLTTDTAAAGNQSLLLSGGEYAAFKGISHVLPGLQPDVVEFDVRVSRLDADGGYFVVGTGTNRSERAVFFLCGPTGMGLYEDDTFFHTVPFETNRWYHISLGFSWTNRTVDYSVDHVLIERGIPFRGTNVAALSRVWLFNFQYTDSWWDNVRFITTNDPNVVAVSPLTAAPFVNGAWNGSVVVTDPVEELVVEARDANGHVGVTAPISVFAPDELVLQVEAAPLPASLLSPLTYRLSAINPGASPVGGVMLTNSIPSGMSLLSFTNSQGGCQVVSNQIACDLGTIGANSTASVTLVTVPGRFGWLTNLVRATWSRSTAGSSNAAVTTLTSVDPPSLSAQGVSVVEGAPNTQTPAQFLLSLSASNPVPTRVRFSTRPGTATESTDYLPANGFVVFPPGVTQQVVTVIVLGDSLPEPSETFGLFLDQPVNATIETHHVNGIILDDDPHVVAAMPFTETWETGTIRPFWTTNGNFFYNIAATASNGPHGGRFHVTMDNGADDGVNTRNELTLSVNLEGWTNVVLDFWALGSFFDSPDGPPPSPFVGSADFDGVALSADGIYWYEIQSLRELTTDYAEYTVDLDAALAAHHLPHTGQCQIRFNQVSSYSFPFSGIALDDISLTGDSAKLVPGATAVMTESCLPGNGAVDPGETVTVSLTLTNIGAIATRGLRATLLEQGGVSDAGATQTYGILEPGASAARTFRFRAAGSCGGQVTATLALDDEGRSLGQIPFQFLLGVFNTNVWEFPRPNPITIAPYGPSIPYPISNVVAGVTGLVRKVTATLHGFSHPTPDDVDIMLMGPNGQTVTLLSDTGGLTPVTNVTLVFDSTVQARLGDNDLIVSGVYSPTNYGSPDAYLPPAPSPPFGNSLAAFNGLDPNGAWVLFVYDDTLLNGGAIAGGWSLQIETGDLSCCGAEVSVDLSLGMRGPTTAVLVDRDITYNLQVTNLGQSPANDVVVTDTLPPGILVRSISVSSGSCTNDNGVIRCELGTLAVTASETITIVAQPNTLGSLTNRATVISREADSEKTNNTAFNVAYVAGPNVSVQALSVREPDSGSVTGQFVVLLGAALARPASFDFFTSGGTAVENVDFIPTEGHLEFAPGETQKTIPVVILGDLLNEDDETLTLNLFNPVNLRLGSSTVTATILDNDPLPSLSISDARVLEGDSGLTPAWLNLRLGTPSGRFVYANFKTLDGTAKAASDYVATNGTLFLQPGQTTTAFQIPVRGDRLNELDESFLVTLSNPVNATLIDSQGAVTIANDDFLPTLAAAGAVLTAEGCSPTNGAVDPGETVTIKFALRNIGTGTAGASNLTATLLPGNGVLSPSASQLYGALAGGMSATQSFSFTADGECGDIINAVFALQDGSTPLGLVTNAMALGRLTTVFAQDFDHTVAFSLPADWKASLSGAGTPWRVTNVRPDTAPYAAFATDPAASSTNDLTSPVFTLSSDQAQLTFRHSYDTEPDFDGGMLQISVDGGPFVDLTDAGGRFIAGSYNGTIDFSTPAWTGSSTGWVSVVATLPPVPGSSVQLRWRFVSDEAIGGNGWTIDTIAVADGFACCVPSPLVLNPIRRFGGSVLLQWNAVPQTLYRIQYKSDLAAMAWTDLPGDVRATGAAAAKVDPIGALQQRFYRVTVVP